MMRAPVLEIEATHLQPTIKKNNSTNDIILDPCCLYNGRVLLVNVMGGITRSAKSIPYRFPIMTFPAIRKTLG